ncbi:hypothetical protein Fmac_011767 [Flemingia macrophylla]|uniref:F-box domain-containing protein n=1 Tax=Flemingia macrophylla TaxID=520843 RepID=A0ABD1MNR3_9FABA
MVDRISSLPDEVLCHILSFIPSKVAVSTSLLSKRWKPLWRLVPALDFDFPDDQRKESYSCFVQSVYTFILSRDLDQPLQRFRVRCQTPLCDTPVVNAWLNTAVQRRVESLYLSLLFPSIHIFSTVLCCKTLVVLKLENIEVNTFCSVDLPSLKILHLDRVIFLDPRHLVEFLSGAPNLEDLEIEDDSWVTNSYDTEGNFRRLPILVKAAIDKQGIPLDLVYKVQLLRQDDMMNSVPLCYKLDIFSAVLSSKTLVVLSLQSLNVKVLCPVDLPSLKILYLFNVEFLDRNQLAMFLSGTPNLEDLEMNAVRFSNHANEVIFRRLTKLLRAVIDKNAVPLDILYNVHFLRIHDVDGEDFQDFQDQNPEFGNLTHFQDQIPEFHNLSGFELCYLNYTQYWTHVFEVLEYCPNLEYLSIDMGCVERDQKVDWSCDSCQPLVPKCISFYLESCCLKNYRGNTGEFKFAKYIMQNARVLRVMTIRTACDEGEKDKLEMLKELSLCRRISSICILSFN